jgi:hypothetical protein
MGRYDEALGVIDRTLATPAGDGPHVVRARAILERYRAKVADAGRSAPAGVPFERR